MSRFIYFNDRPHEILSEERESKRENYVTGPHTVLHDTADQLRRDVKRN
jgi:hypothetical protein